MSYIKVDIQPKSINQLRKEHPDLFYSDWYTDEEFAKSKPRAETLWINPQIDGSLSKSYYDQEARVIQKAQDSFVPTLNQLIQTLITRYEATGNRLLSDSWSRTADVAASGRRVGVGFYPDGFDVSSWFEGPYSYMGVAEARKSDPGTSTIEPLKLLNLDARIEKLESQMDIIKDAMNILEGLTKL